VIGDSGDIKTEGDVILLEHGLEFSNFSKSVYACLPPEGEDWKIPPTELAKRLDLRHLAVCSIDPMGCKDIDDALHCLKLPNGHFQVGVHIADVSYFVKPGTAIDLEASSRCTTIYLEDRRTDMLPKLLTEKLCSLVSGMEKLSFSVIWEMDSEAKIISTQFAKTVILSKGSLNYQEAQQMIDDPKDNSALTKSIRMLNALSQKLKQKRLQNGALTLASTQVKFTFDDETHSPSDV